MASMFKVGKHATTVATTHGGWHVVTYHETEVVRWSELRNLVILQSGGWRTATTKTRMNQAANQYDLGYQVFQDNGDWFVNLDGGKIVKFVDGMEFALKGKTTI